MEAAAAQPNVRLRGEVLRRQIALFIAVLVGCRVGSETGAAKPTDVLALGRAAPDVRGLYLCRFDSIAAAHGDPKTQCRAGDDTTFEIRRDTVVYISVEEALEVPDSVSLFDFWHSTLRAEWTAKLGAPTDIADDSRSVPPFEFEYFEVRWDRQDGRRDLVTLSRSPGRWARLRWVALSCLESEAIGCK